MPCVCARLLVHSADTNKIGNCDGFPINFTNKLVSACDRINLRSTHLDLFVESNYLIYTLIAVIVECFFLCALRSELILQIDKCIIVCVRMHRSIDYPSKSFWSEIFRIGITYQSITQYVCANRIC